HATPTASETRSGRGERAPPRCTLPLTLRVARLSSRTSRGSPPVRDGAGDPPPRAEPAVAARETGGDVALVGEVVRVQGESPGASVEGGEGVEQRDRRYEDVARPVADPADVAHAAAQGEAGEAEQPEVVHGPGGGAVLRNPLDLLVGIEV